MSKLTYQDKINIYKERKQGNSIVNISKKYDVRKELIKHLVRLIDKHGYDILRTNKNRIFSLKEKERIINRVLVNNESDCSVAVDEGLLSYGMLFNWIKNYKNIGYNIVEQRRGRSPIMLKKTKNPNIKETIEQENERLKKENEYLKAELEYSKKLRTVFQARKNQQQKKK